ncbi:MAG: hypothetical protein IGR80_15560 [Synechococcales cyanobacterium K44_A2020_017]|nr:hypothetical protein [Synechococcales cyanobacterium K32_A2020_035]MBF2096159.1 hypothetical protein [Synechococcales cyanobacterium K44_A2020_017]
MCFSATASFSISAALLPIGGWCINKAWQSDRHYLPLAVFPLAFGIQQAIEGMVWLGLDANNSAMVAAAATGFIFFSHGFWLVWTPFMALMIETRSRLRRLWQIMTLLGMILAAYFLVPLALNPTWLTVTIQERSLTYILQDLTPYPSLEALGRSLYISTILAPLLLVNQSAVQRLGWLVLGALVIVSRFFSSGLVSTWCYFAAVASLYVGYLFYQDITEKRSLPAEEG